MDCIITRNVKDYRIDRTKESIITGLDIPHKGAII